MKRILLIGTGGTIASENTDDGLSPMLGSDQLLRCVPRIAKLCDVECFELMCVESTNVTPSEWLDISRCIEQNYDAYDGFVISHGTDTMAYTAAALSYLVRHSEKPIVMTGAQKPIGMDGTDAKQNLLDAFTYACDDCASGVSVVFDGKAILGTRARKVRTKSFSAFASISSVSSYSEYGWPFRSCARTFVANSMPPMPAPAKISGCASTLREVMKPPKL